MNQALAAGPQLDLAEARALCERKLAAGDLGLYYGLQFASAAQRADATPLYAFWLEVREINDECSDPAVARVKLAWWSEEIEAIFAGRPRHPIAIALAPVVARRLPASPFHELLEALARHVGVASYPNREALREHALRTRGQLETLAARLAFAEAPPSAPAIAQLAALLEEVEFLRDAGADARRGRAYFMARDIDRLDAMDDLRRGEASQVLCDIIVSTAERLGREIDRASTVFTGAERRPLRPLLIAAAIARALLQRIQRRPQRVLRERLRVSPPRQLWIAWRTALATG